MRHHRGISRLASKAARKHVPPIAVRSGGGVEARLIHPLTHTVIPMRGTEGIADYACKASDNDLYRVVKGGTVVVGVSLYTAAAVSPMTVSVTLPQGLTSTLQHIKVTWAPRYGWYSFGIESANKLLMPSLLVKDDSLVQVHPTDGSYTVAGATKSAVAVPRPYVPYTHTTFPVQDSQTLPAFSMATNEQKCLLIDVTASTSLAAGYYPGEVRILVGRGVACTLPISIRVLPFSYPPTTRHFGTYMEQTVDPTLSNGNTEVGGTSVSEGHLTALLQACKATGLNPTCYNAMGVSSAGVTRTAFLRHLDLRAAAGLNTKPLYMLGLTTGQYAANIAGKIAIKADVTTLLGLTAPYGIPSVYIYGRDERPDLLAADEILFDGVREAGGKVMVATSPDAYTSMRSPGKLDMPILSGYPSSAQIAAWQAAGCTVAKYATPQGRPNSPAMFRRSYGWWLWAMNLQGYIHWALSRYYNDPWNDFDHASIRDECLLYPDARPSTIHTLALRGVREGITDLRFIETLEAAITSAAAGAKKTAAQSFLDTTKISLQAEWSAATADSVLLRDWHALRNTVIDHILALLE